LGELTDAQVERLIAEVDQGVWRGMWARVTLLHSGRAAHLARFARALREHPSPNVRAAMVGLVVGQETLAWHPLLSRALQDEHPHVRMAAANALKTRGTTEDLESLADGLRRALDQLIGRGQWARAEGEGSVVLWSAEAIAAIAERGSAPGRVWALAFLQQVERDLSEECEPVSRSIQRLEQVIRGDLPRPAGPPTGPVTRLPIPQAPSD
jgi:hypothetical protein